MAELLRRRRRLVGTVLLGLGIILILGGPVEDPIAPPDDDS